LLTFFQKIANFEKRNNKHFKQVKVSKNVRTKFEKKTEKLKKCSDKILKTEYFEKKKDNFFQKC